MDPGDAGNLESRLTSRAETESVLCAARDAIARIESLAPANSRLPGNVIARMTSVGNEVALCFRGLEFAHWSREGITFGLGEARRPLTEGARPRLLCLLRDLSRYRSPLASETTNPLFRAAPERWLEALVLEDCRRIDPRLDERYRYLSPEISITRIGVTETWRCGLKVVLRQ